MGLGFGFSVLDLGFIGLRDGMPIRPGRNNMHLTASG